MPLPWSICIILFLLEKHQQQNHVRYYEQQVHPPVTAGDASEVFVRSKMKEGSVYFIEASEPLDHQ